MHRNFYGGEEINLSGVGRPLLLNTDHEHDLFVWIVDKKNGLKTINSIRQKALEYLPAGSNTPSRAWVRNFLKRNDVPLKNPKLFSPARYVDPGTIIDWFSSFKQEKYVPALIFNFDETFLDIGKKNRSKVALPPEYDCRPLVTGFPRELKHITYCPMICADGTALPELIVISDCVKYFGDSSIMHDGGIWSSSDQYPKIVAYHSNKGWINNYLFEQIIRRNIIPYIDAKRSHYSHLHDLWAILYTDSHHSRFNHSLLRELQLHRIDLCVFPSKCSHLMQPLDVKVFAAFKNKFRSRLTELLLVDYIGHYSKAQFFRYAVASALLE